MEKAISDCLWSKTSAETFSAAPLHEHVEADIVVIGGGYTGLNVALEAANRGAKVALVEAEEFGYGGSGRNVGLVNAGLWLPPESINQELGPTVGSQLTSVLSNAPEMVFGLIEKHSIQCNPVRSGTLHCAHSPSGLADLQARHAQWQNLGAPLKLIDAEETHSRTGAMGLYGALFDPRAGTIQPMAYAKGLARAASQAGALLFENTPALSLGWEGGKWEISTPKGLVRAKAMVLATNAYPFRMSWVQTLKTIPINYFQAATEPLPKDLQKKILSDGEGCWDTSLIMSSWRLDAEGRLIIGGMGKIYHFAGGIHKSWLKRKIAKLYPELADIGLETFWQGRIAMTKNKLPKVWRMGPSAYACFGYSGRGIAPGTVFGQRLATCVLERAEEVLPLVPVNENAIRATRLTGTIFETGATLAHLVKDRF